VLYFNTASNEIVCVISDEPTSLTDAYALIKVLCRSYGEKSFSILVNNVKDEQRGRNAFNRLASAVGRFLQVKLSYMGFVPADRLVTEAVQLQRAVVEEFPSSPAARALRRLAGEIDKDAWTRSVKGGVQFFFRQLLEYDAMQAGERV
jgi:flagellar biosynthesis protein FlhG